MPSSSIRNLVGAALAIAIAIAGRELSWRYILPSVQASAITQAQYSTVTRTLTPSEIQNLDTIPIVLVPAQGPDTVITFVTGFFSLDFQTTPYDDGGFAYVVIAYEGTGTMPDQYPWFIGGDIFGATESVFYPGILGTDSNFSSNTGMPVASAANKAVQLQSDVPLTAGDSPVTIQFQYYVRRL